MFTHKSLGIRRVPEKTWQSYLLGKELENERPDAMKKRITRSYVISHKAICAFTYFNVVVVVVEPAVLLSIIILFGGESRGIARTPYYTAEDCDFYTHIIASIKYVFFPRAENYRLSARDLTHSEYRIKQVFFFFFVYTFSSKRTRVVISYSHRSSLTNK